LPQKIQNSLKLKRMRVIIVLQDSSSDLTFETFTRINTEGEPLTAQEIRNVAFRGPLNDLIIDLAKNPFLLQQFKLVDPKNVRYKKMDDVQLVLRALTLAENWRTFSGDLRATMDSYMREHRNEDVKWLQDKARLFQAAMASAENIWGDQAFHMPKRDQAINSLFDAQIVSLMLRIEEGKSSDPAGKDIMKMEHACININERAKGKFIDEIVDKTYHVYDRLSNGKRYYLRWIDYENETRKKIKTPQIYKDKIKEFIGSEDYEKFKPSYDLGYFYIDDNDEVRVIDLSLDYYVVETTYTLSGDEASGIKFTKNRYINVAGDNYFYLIDSKFQKINK